MEKILKILEELEGIKKKSFRWGFFGQKSRDRQRESLCRILLLSFLESEIKWENVFCGLCPDFKKTEFRTTVGEYLISFEKISLPTNGFVTTYSFSVSLGAEKDVLFVESNEFDGGAEKTEESVRDWRSSREWSTEISDLIKKLFVLAGSHPFSSA